MAMQSPPAPEPEQYRHVEPIFDASGTLRHVPASKGERSHASKDRQSAHPAR